jgi:hypothetical protein
VLVFWADANVEDNTTMIAQASASIGFRECDDIDDLLSGKLKRLLESAIISRLRLD